MLTSSNIKAWSKCLFYEQQCSECKFSFAFWVILESGYPVNAKHAELERRSAYQLRLKAVEMLRSRTQLVKSHRDDIGLEYLWNGDEYSSLGIQFFGKQFESNGEKRRICRTARNLITSACYGETNHCSLSKLRQRHCIWRNFYWSP